METTGDGVSERRLRAVGEGSAGRDELRDAVLACARGGVETRELRRAVAGRLALPAEAVPGEPLAAALGLLIATGRVDERGGRLLAVPQERRRAG